MWEGVLSLNTVKYIVAAVVVLFITLLVYFLFRDSSDNNLRWARKHHKKGLRFYKKGEHDKAQLHYEIAKQYREKAVEREQ